MMAGLFSKNAGATSVLLLMLLLFNLAFTPAVTAQTLANLYSFTSDDSPPYTNRDGAHPGAGLIVSSNTLYGTTYDGGSSGNGSVFRVHLDSSGFTNLYSFSGPYANHSSVTNKDGANPLAGLVLSGVTLYGTASGGGASGNGTIFAVNTDGKGFKNLHSFAARSRSAPSTNTDGFWPRAGLVLLGNTLFGTATAGGKSGMGAVFAIHTNGTSFTNLHSFSAASTGLIFTNRDGAVPQAGLILSSNTLYGTASRGGVFGQGAVFRLNTNGTCFTNLHNFSASAQNPASELTNSDGGMPLAGLSLLGHALFGTTESGGIYGPGTVFAINTDGTGFTNLHNFTLPDASGTNRDGAFPEAGLTLSGNTLYGTADVGGANNGGVVFAINADGAGFTNLFSFGSSTGLYPDAGLIQVGNTLYGTTSEGGSWSAGEIFSLPLPEFPPLKITVSSASIVLTWPAGATHYTLLSAPDLLSATIWRTNSLSPVIINGQNVLTNSISAAQQYYRLSQ
jgi:uncharacterized repeat protein (TIGR03803 family)